MQTRSPRLPRLHAPACTLLLTLVASLCLNAQAQSVEPGLWEVNTILKMPDNPQFEAQMAQAQAQLKNLPPEVRKQLGQSLGIGVGSPGNNSLRMCLSPEQAQSPMSQKGQDDCTYTPQGQSGNTFRGTVVCPTAGSKGDFVTTLHNKSHYSTVATLTSAQGRMQISSEAKRLGANCGDLAAGAAKR